MAANMTCTIGWPTIGDLSTTIYLTPTGVLCVLQLKIGSLNLIHRCCFEGTTTRRVRLSRNVEVNSLTF